MRCLSDSDGECHDHGTLQRRQARGEVVAAPAFTTHHTDMHVTGRLVALLLLLGTCCTQAEEQQPASGGEEGRWAGCRGKDQAHTDTPPARLYLYTLGANK